MRDALEGDLGETGRREAATAACLADSVDRRGSTHASIAPPLVPGAGVCKSLAGRAA